MVHFLEDFLPNIISTTLNLPEKLIKETSRILDIWTEKKVSSIEKLKKMKLNLITSMEEPINSNYNNPVFVNLVNNKKIKIKASIFDYINNYENFDKFSMKASKSLNEGQNEEYNRFIMLENKYRENLLKNNSDIIKNQVDRYQKHVELLNEVDLMIGKMNMIKNSN